MIPQELDANHQEEFDHIRARREWAIRQDRALRRSRRRRRLVDFLPAFLILVLICLALIAAVLL